MPEYLFQSDQHMQMQSLPLRADNRDRLAQVLRRGVGRVKVNVGHERHALLRQRVNLLSQKINFSNKRVSRFKYPECITDSMRGLSGNDESLFSKTTI